MRRKTIPIPGIHDVDIAPILPIIDHRVFQRLRYKKQLGVCYTRFPSANHTRFEHALGTYSLALERVSRPAQMGSISSRDVQNVPFLGLLHDLGHEAYSHLSEDLCEGNHKARGVELLYDLRGPIQECGGDFEYLVQLFQKTAPVEICISHHPLGCDKLDYLVRDAWHTNEAVALTVGILLDYVYFTNGTLVIDKTVIDEVMQAQRAHVYMYGEVYWAKKCLIAERFLQKILMRLILVGETSLKEIAKKDDSQLDAVLHGAKDSLVREQWEEFRYHEFPKAAIVLCPARYIPEHASAHKPVVACEAPLESLRTLQCLQKPDVVGRMEEDIAQMLQLPADSVLITPPKPEHRFLLPDIDIHDGPDGSKIGSLKGYRPVHYQTLEELARAHLAVRVCVPREHRRRVANQSQPVVDYLLKQADLV